jgi:hypothetical protein
VSEENPKTSQNVDYSPCAVALPAKRVVAAEEARAARAPRPPEELVGAFQDRVHRESGALRAARSVRVRKKEPQ